MSSLTTDLTIEDELKAWRLKLHKAEADGSVDAAVLCWRRLNHLLDRYSEQQTTV